MCKKDWDFEEDEIISKECDVCEELIEHGDLEDMEECPNCGGENLINNTCHEGLECEKCNKNFDIGEDGYRHYKETDQLICKDCYNALDKE